MSNSSQRTWSMHTLGDGHWSRPRVYTVTAASPLPVAHLGRANTSDPLQQRYSLLWSRTARVEARCRHGYASGTTLWVFDREELLQQWVDLLRERGHMVPCGLPSPTRDSYRDGILHVTVPWPRPLLPPATRPKLVSIPVEVLPTLTRRIPANLFRISEMRTDDFWGVYLMGRFEPCPPYSTEGPDATSSKAD